jgi:alkylated DNA repair protein alkB family protein 8
LLAFPKEDKEASRLENKYVSQVYENIADHFDYTRNSLWSAFVTFLNSLPEWSLVFDAGCGNGKYLVSDFKLVRIGSDICANLAKISAQKGGCVFRANLLELPVLDNSFDAVICSAVVHHFSTEERRLRAFKEIARVLRVGGRALVSGWSKEQGDSFYQKMRANRIEGI